MNLLDALVLALLFLGLLSGARAGFLGPVLGLVGAVAGFALGRGRSGPSSAGHSL